MSRFVPTTSHFLAAVALAMSLIAAERAAAEEPAKAREVAEWVLAKKGSVRVVVERNPLLIREAGALPKESFTMQAIELPYAAAVDGDMRRFADLTGLTQIKLSGSPITDEGLVHLAGLKQLTGIELFDTKITDAGLRHLAGIRKLILLNLGRTQVGDEGAKFIAATFPDMFHLNLTATKVTDAGLPPLAALPRLVYLALAETAVSDAGVAELVKSKSLRELSLTRSKITDVGALRLAELPQLGNLQLHFTQVTAAGRDALQAKLPKCRILWTAGAPAQQPPPASIAAAPPKIATPMTAGPPVVIDAAAATRAREVAEWVLSNKGYVTVVQSDGSLGVQALGQLPKKPFTLALINLRNAQISDQDLRRLVGVAGLVHLQLDQCPITDAGLAYLAELKELTSLNLYGTKITDAGMRRLAGLTKLTGLDIGHTKVGDEGLKVVAGFPELTYLNLTGNSVSDAGLAALAPLEKLLSLNLKGTAVTDAGVPHLAKLKSLLVLDLSNGFVGDAGAAQLTALDKLTILTLRFTYVSRAGYEPLQAKLPKCRIEWAAASNKSGPPPVVAGADERVKNLGLKVTSARLMQPTKIESVFSEPRPKFLDGAVVFTPFPAQGGFDPALGAIEVKVEKKTGVFVAVSWKDEEGRDEPWVKERLTERSLAHRGWVLVGELNLVGTKWEPWSLFWRECAAGETLQLRTRRAIVPLVITVADASFDPLASLPDSSMSAGLADRVTAAKVRNDFRLGRFAELERQVAQLRKDRPRDREGRSYLSIFYDGADMRGETAEEWEAARQRHEAWLAAFPRSVAAHAAFANYWRSYAWHARGSGYAAGVAEADFELYRERVRKAREIVTQGYELDEKDPFLCLVDVCLAIDLSDTKEQVEAIVRRSLSIDPDYVSTLAEVGRYYLPRWHGEPGELEAWAERAAELTKERWGDAVYTLVVMTATDHHTVTVFTDFKFSWPRTRQGFADLRKRSPDSQLYADFTVRLAGFNGDRPAAQQAFATLDRVRGGAGDPRSETERMWRIWSQDDFLTGDQERVIDVAHNPILRVEWPIDGKRWVVLDNHGELMTFEAETGKLASRVDLGDYEYAKFSSVVPFGKLVVAANYDDTVTSYKIPGGERRVLGKQHQITAAALSTDGAEYATAGNDRKIKFWKLDREEDFPDEWDFAPNYPAALAYLPGGRMMVVGGAEGTIGIWDRDTKKQTGELEKRKTGIRFLAVSPDGEQLAVADWKELTLWRIKTKELVASFPVPSGGMNDLVFSRDGRFVAAATGRKRGGDGHVVVWSTADKKLLHTFRGHKDLVYSVCFSPDGSRVVSGSEDMTIRVWKVE